MSFTALAAILPDKPEVTGFETQPAAGNPVRILSVTPASWPVSY